MNAGKPIGRSGQRGGTQGFLRALGADLAALFRSPRVVAPTVLVAVLSYAFMIANPSIGVDDAAIGAHQRSGLILGGRFGWTLFGTALRIGSFQPVYGDALGVLLLVLGAFLWCVLFRRASGGTLGEWACAAFVSSLVCYPLVNELFIYYGGSATVGLGFVLTGLALLLLQHDESPTQGGRTLRTAVAVGLATLAVSMYESFAVVMLFGLLASPFVRHMVSAGSPEKDPRALRNAVRSLAVLAGGIALRYGIALALGFVARALGQETGTGGAQNSIRWLVQPFGTTLGAWLAGNVVDYALAALYYLPIALFWICLLVGFLLCAVRTRRRTGAGARWLLFGGTVASLFALSLLQGLATPYRANQAIALFVALVLMLAVHSLLAARAAPWLRAAGAALVALMILWQSADLNHWFYVDALRSQEETRTIPSVCLAVESAYGFGRPVVFTGTHEVPSVVRDATELRRDGFGGRAYLFLQRLWKPGADNAASGYLYKYNQTVGNSVLAWGVKNGMVVEYARMNGFDLVAGDEAMREDAAGRSAGMPAWPTAGSIVDRGDYVQVNLG